MQKKRTTATIIKPSKTIDPTVGDGFPGIQKVDNWLSHAMWADLIFCTSNCAYIPQLDRVKRAGAKVFGPSVASADLEIKRGEGMKFLEEHGIEVPPYKTFKTLKDAEKYVWKTEERWVFKTLGDNEDKSLSYCGKSPADMISRLRRWQEMGMNPKGEVMLQQFIPGIEMGVSRWIGKDGWCSPPNINFEHKKLMPKNYGPNTGEMATIMAYEAEEKMSKDLLDPIEADMVKMGHLGDMDINCIIDEKGKAWPLEFTNRPGWPAFNMMLSQHKGDPIQWMADAIDGKNTLQVSYEAGVCIVICQPKFPYADPDLEKTSGIPIYGITDKNKRYIQPQGVKKMTLVDDVNGKPVEQPMWATAGDYIAVVNAMGPNIKKAAERAYKTVDELSVPDMIVRAGVGDDMEEKLAKLQAMGYAKGISYGG
jgi:phosphoribosylamine--glycine ligase